MVIIRGFHIMLSFAYKIRSTIGTASETYSDDLNFIGDYKKYNSPKELNLFF